MLLARGLRSLRMFSAIHSYISPSHSKNPDIGAIRAGPSQTATFMPLWIYNIQVCKRSDMKNIFKIMALISITQHFLVPIV